MRKGFATCVAAAVTLVALLAAQAVGQEADSFGLDIEMAPKKGGTVKKPRPIKLSGELRFPRLDSGIAGPVMTGGRIVLPHGLVLAGGNHRACSRATIEGDGGYRSCPKRSIVGGGATTGIADTVGVRPKMVFINGGPRRIWAHTTLYFPAFVQELVAIDVKRPRRPRDGYVLSFTVPKTLREVAGVRITPTDPTAFYLGGKAYAKNYLTTTRRCPKRGYLIYTMTIDYLDPDDVSHEATDRGRIGCK
jgi:hypothetical protein